MLLQPDLCFQALAGIFAAVERAGRWPRAVRSWRTAFLPKQADEAKALPTPVEKLRPLSIGARAYRVWAALRFEQL
eukprot:11913474-Alexandrium_andersonii.AAC.1